MKYKCHPVEEEEYERELLPPRVQTEQRREETESMELSKAEAVAVWYGSIVSTQQLNATGDLLFHFRKWKIKNQLIRGDQSID